MKIESLLKQAYWIWPGLLHDDARNVYADFRYDFRIKRRKGTARLAITADQSYVLFINGKYIGRGPARGYQWIWPYDEHEVSKRVRPGHNWISVRVHNAGCGTFQYLHQGAYGMICAGEICGERILSGEGWVGQVSAANRQDTTKLSVQLNYQEWIDARVDDQNWIRQAKCPLKQNGQMQRRPFGVMPWHRLEKRGIPNLGNEVLGYQRLRATGTGRCDAHYKDDRNPAAAWYRELRGITWKETGGAWDKTITLAPAGRGRLKAVVLDMGRPTIGTLIVDVKDGEDGEVLDFFFCEVVSRNGRPLMHDPKLGCMESMSARLILRRGQTQHEFFQMIGHRYVTVIARETTKPLKIQIRLRETVYPLKIKGRFRTGDSMLEDIYRICMQTQRVCCLDSYVDTPWREQGQWWGDARIQSQNTFHLSGDSRLLARGIRSIARQEVPNGLTYGLAPTIAHTCILPDFSIIWVLTVWDYYYQTGDMRLFTEQWPRIERLLGYFRGEGRSRNGLLRYDPRYWLFLDWCEIHRSGNPALLNLWYLLMLGKLMEMTRIAGMKNREAEMNSEYRRHKRLVLKYFWDNQAGLFHDGLTPEGRPAGIHSIHTQTLAILCGLQPSGWKAMIERRLRPYMRGMDIPGAKPSSYWATYVYEVMEGAGYGIEVVKHIRKNWSPMIPYGGTWETFANKFGFNSVSHAWAAHPLYHLARTLGGIRQNGAAWKEILYQPVIMPEYGFAEAIVPTPQGIIRSGWEVKRDKAEVVLELPPGVRADVSLPGVQEQMMEKKKWIITL